jgi:hypothetical protein
LRQHHINRMCAWITLLALGLALGLPLNHTTIFWVGILSLWVLI